MRQRSSTRLNAWLYATGLHATSLLVCFKPDRNRQQSLVTVWLAPATSRPVLESIKRWPTDRQRSLRIDNVALDKACSIQNMRPKSRAESLASSAVRSLLSGLGAAAGAVPLLGGMVNFAVGSTGWAEGDGRIGFGMIGTASNLLGTAAVGAKFVTIAGLSLASVAGPIVAGALGVSALCAGASAWIAGGKS